MVTVPLSAAASWPADNNAALVAFADALDCARLAKKGPADTFRRMGGGWQAACIQVTRSI